MTRGTTESEPGKAAVDLAGELAGAALPGLGAVSKVFAVGLLREWGRNRSVALRAAERASGMTREEIGEAIAEDPRLVPLATRLLHAAGMNGHDRTLKAMGAAFGDALRDRQSVDECELILASLVDVTDAHTLIMIKLTETGPYTEPVDSNDPDRKRSRGWRPDTLQQAMPLPSRVTALCVAALIARGLVRISDTWAAVYELTELGRVLLEVVEQHAAEAE